jgi:hypothetical protein
MYDESKYPQVRGTGVVVTGGAASKTTLSWQQERSAGSFTQVPANTRLIITDFVYMPQGDLTSNRVINVAEARGGGDTIVLQLFVDPKATTQAHFLTGFVIGPGSTVTAFSDAGGPQGQHVSLTLIGYLARPLALRAAGRRVSSRSKR